MSRASASSSASSGIATILPSGLATAGRHWSRQVLTARLDRQKTLTRGDEDASVRVWRPVRQQRRRDQISKYRYPSTFSAQGAASMLYKWGFSKPNTRINVNPLEYFRLRSLNRLCNATFKGFSLGNLRILVHIIRQL